LSEIFGKPRLSSTKTCEISPYFPKFYSGFDFALKKFTRVLSHVVCTQGRRPVHKQIIERRYWGEKPGRFVFGKPVLFTLGLGLTTPDNLGILVWNFNQTFVTVSTLFWLRFERQIRPTRLAINFLFITVRAERKVRLCVKLLDFFRGWILIRLTLNLSRFIPNSVETLTWNFRKNLFHKNFSEILAKPRLSSTKTCEISPYLPKFYSVSNFTLQKFTRVLLHVFCTQLRSHVHKQITERRYGGEKLGRFVLGKPVLFSLGLGLTTPYSLGFLVWNFYQTFDHVSTEFWLRFEPQIRPTRLAIKFLFITTRAERKVLLCVKLLDFSWANTHPFNLKFVAFCPKFSWDSYVEFQWKTISGEFFRNFGLTKAILYQDLWNFALLSEILFWVRIALIKFTQVLSYVFCTQVRRHVHKKITKRRYGVEKSRRFVFGKPVLFSLGLGLTTPYSLGILVSNFARHSSLCVLSFGWDLSPRFLPQDRK